MKRSRQSTIMSLCRFSIGSVIGVVMVLACAVGTAQQPPFGGTYDQPYTPTVVGGVPPGSKNLQRPVYLAEKAGAATPATGFGAKPNYEVPEGFSTETYFPLSDFDENTAVSRFPLEKGNEFTGGMVVAIIGEEYILVGHLVDPARITPEMAESREFEMRLRKALVESVTRKALAQEFFGSQLTGKSKKDREDALKKMNARVATMFTTKIVPDQMERMKCESREELRKKLEAMGSSEHAMMREFAESVWAQQAIKDHVHEKPIFNVYELRDYYTQHGDDWHRPLRIRFRILSALFNKYPSREAAYADIVEMGNEVYFGGSFEGVAKRKSSGFNAKDGGVFDWTTRGALKSKEIEEVAFAIEPKALSQIFEDKDGYHIVEVLEREEEYTMSFAQAQSEIREKLAKEKQDKQRKEYIQKVREKTKIWTRWPEDIPGSIDISEVMK